MNCEEVNDNLSFECACFTSTLFYDQDINECETVVCNGGLCNDLIDDYMCDCFQDYTGQHCEHVIDNCASSPCDPLNSLLCEDTNGTFTCQCFAGFTGHTCQEILTACSSNPCSNGGTCTDEPLGTFSCECAFGFAGDRCEISVTLKVV